MKGTGQLTSERARKLQQYVSEIFHIYTLMYKKEKVIYLTKKTKKSLKIPKE
jgi:hypothetical protein